MFISADAIRRVKTKVTDGATCNIPTKVWRLETRYQHNNKPLKSTMKQKSETSFCASDLAEREKVIVVQSKSISTEMQRGNYDLQISIST